MKLILSAVILFAVSYASNTYAQNWLWAKASAGPSGEDGSCVTTDAYGNIVVTGIFCCDTAIFGSTILINSTPNDNDIFLVKYDPFGKVLWATSAGSAGWGICNSVTTDAYGNIYITGWFDAPTITFGSSTLTKIGSRDVFFIKYSSTGNVLWAKNFGGVGADNKGFGTTTDPAGNIYLTGSFSSPAVTFGSFTLSSMGGYDVYLVKFDPSSNILWATSSGGTIDEVSASVGSDQFGNVFITGNFDSPSISFGSFTLTNAHLFIAKYNSAGNVLWAKSAGSGNGAYDYAFSVNTDPVGNAYMTGSFSDPSITFGAYTIANANPTTPDVFLAKYDASGTALWLRGGGGKTFDYGYTVATDIYNNIYLSGSFSSSIVFGLDTLNAPSGSIYPMFICKYNSAGKLLCASALASGGNGGNGYSPATISPDTLGNAYVTGSFVVNPFIVGPDTLLLTGSGNMFLAKYTCCSNNFTATISGTDTTCSGNTLSLSSNGAPHYLWNNGSTSQTISVHPTSTDTYSLAITDNFGCVADTTFTITVLPNPIATASNNITIYNGQTTTLSASGGTNYLWGNGETTTTLVVSPSATTVYCFTITDTYNCKDSACITVTIEDPCDTAGTFFFPNAFSPNRDDGNDLLRIYYLNMSCIKELHLTIYDRWGERVFETSDPEFRWDGTNHRKIMNPQVLSYHLFLQFADRKEINRKGNISLVR